MNNKIGISIVHKYQRSQVLYKKYKLHAHYV